MYLLIDPTEFKCENGMFNFKGKKYKRDDIFHELLTCSEIWGYPRCNYLQLKCLEYAHETGLS